MLRNRLLTGLLIALVLSMFAGCGQKGPLYLPDKTSSDDSVKPARSALVAVDKSRTGNTR